MRRRTPAAFRRCRSSPFPQGVPTHMPAAWQPFGKFAGGVGVGRRILSASRYLIVIAAACIFATATALLCYGAAETYTQIAGLFGGANAKGTKGLILAAIELVDLFLLATVLYVIAVGLYELFIDDQLPLPAWLVIHNLDDL